MSESNRSVDHPYELERSSRTPRMSLFGAAMAIALLNGGMPQATRAIRTTLPRPEPKPARSSDPKARTDFRG